MMSRELEEIKNKIIPVLQRHDIKRAAIFGSFVREEQKKTVI